ncbi:hypothetical protein Acsp04_50950 [Actinomadura sp. NBRC 104425]|nr:hypothetical protein Acsp04_50950 [Actinomadura sp. NBRC 104425]
MSVAPTIMRVRQHAAGLGGETTCSANRLTARLPSRAITGPLPRGLATKVHCHPASRRQMPLSPVVTAGSAGMLRMSRR